MKFFLLVFLIFSANTFAWTPCEGDWAIYDVETQNGSKTAMKKVEILYKKVDLQANEVTQQMTETFSTGEKKITESKMSYSAVKKENETIIGSLSMLCRASKLESIKTPSGIFKACALGTNVLKTWYMADVTFNLVKETQTLADKTVISTLVESFKSACPKNQ
jgi:hypothetical protein